MRSGSRARRVRGEMFRVSARFSLGIAMELGNGTTRKIAALRPQRRLRRIFGTDRPSEGKRSNAGDQICPPAPHDRRGTLPCRDVPSVGDARIVPKGGRAPAGFARAVQLHELLGHFLLTGRRSPLPTTWPPSRPDQKREGDLRRQTRRKEEK